VEEHYRIEGKPVPSKAVIQKARAMLLSRETQIHVHPLVSLQAMLEMRAKVAEFIYDMQWRLLRAPDGSRFMRGTLRL
jgi:hypothetical protein